MKQTNVMTPWIGKVLLTSIIVALIMIIGGGGWYLWHHALLPFDEHVFHSETTKFTTFSHVVANFWSPLGLIQGGLFIIIAGQIFRVALTGVMFYVERDKFFMLCTAIILLVMLVGFFG